MNYCPRCGVVLAEDATRCPLCGSVGVSEKPTSADSGGLEYPGSPRFDASRDDPSSNDALSDDDRRRVAVELLSVAFGIAFAVTLLVDLFINRSLSWSLYAATAIVAAWLVGAMPLILYRHPWILFAVLGPSLVFLVFLMDVFDGRLGWFLWYGLPISLCFEISVVSVAALICTQRRKGLNVVALILCGSAFFCFGIETAVDLNQPHSLSYDWSVVVALALVPTAGILFYLHYRIVNRASLKKLFRL